MKTNLEKCKNVAKSLFDVDMRVIEEYGVVQHPWISSTVCPTKIEGEPGFLSIDDEGFIHACKERAYFQINSCNSVSEICFYMNKPYRLTYINMLFNCELIDENDLGTLLQDVWSSVENISQDVNVSCKDLVEMFKFASHETLMSDDEYSYFDSLPDMVTLYRGVTDYNVNEGLAMSWTDSEDIARWFANRFKSERRYIWEIRVPKHTVLSYFDNRSESECVLDTTHIEAQLAICNRKTIEL